MQLPLQGLRGKMENENQLVKWDELKYQIATAKDIVVLSKIGISLEVMQKWAKQSGQSLETQNEIAEYRLRLDRKRGEWVKENILERPGNPTNQLAQNGQLIKPTLTQAGISHHESPILRGLAELPEGKFEKIIEEPKKRKIELTRKSAIRAIREQKRTQDKEAINSKTFPIIEGKFKTILIDPSWDYQQLSLAGRGHPEYAPMSLEELRNLNINQYAENNCHLYLWSTNNFLYEALKLGELWGFNYKTVLTWLKPSMGLGSYFRNSTEQLLFFVKGQLSTRTNNTLTHFEAPRAQHSKKPEISYQIIEENSYPAFLELFGREKRENWTVWGNINV